MEGYWHGNHSSGVIVIGKGDLSETFFFEDLCEKGSIYICWHIVLYLIRSFYVMFTADGDINTGLL